MAYKRQSPEPVIEGGTGIQSATAYGTLAGGTTTTGALQPISPGTSGFVLKSNGSSSLPSFQSNGGTGTNYLPLWTHRSFTNSRLLFVAADTSSTSTQYVTYLMQLSITFTPATTGVGITIISSMDGVTPVTYSNFQGISYPYNSTTPTLYNDKIIGNLTNGVTYSLNASIWFFDIYTTGIVGRSAAQAHVAGRYTCYGSDGSSVFGTVAGVQISGGSANNYFGISAGNLGLDAIMTGTLSVWALREY